jgi:hypothetical protein
VQALQGEAHRQEQFQAMEMTCHSFLVGSCRGLSTPKEQHTIPTVRDKNLGS